MSPAAGMQVVDRSLEAISAADAWRPPPGSQLQQDALSVFRGAVAQQSAPLLLLRGLCRHCARSTGGAERVCILAAAAEAAAEVPQAFGVSAVAACESDLVRVPWLPVHIACRGPAGTGRELIMSFVLPIVTTGVAMDT